MAITLVKKSDIVKNITAKELWKSEETSRIEEKCMSPFVVEHLDEISEITGYDLEMTNMELYVGDFRADIVCKDNNTGDIIVIENQLDQSDHDHLGKALTYLTNLDAKGIIWICENVRSEHLKAVEKLNEITSDEYNFYFLELKFEQYGDNKPVYDFVERFAPSSINKLANRLRNASEGFIEVNSFFEKFIGELKEIIPTAHIIKGKTYHRIYARKPIYMHIARSPKELDKIKMEIGYDENNIAKNSSKEECQEQFDQLKNSLDKLGYKYNEKMGKKNTSLHKLTLSMDFNAENTDYYKEVCYSIYKAIIETWKK